MKYKIISNKSIKKQLKKKKTEKKKQIRVI